MTNKQSNEYNDARYTSELIENDGRPVVVGYLRVSLEPNSNEPSLQTQQACVLRACERRFPEGFHLILVADKEALGHLPFKPDGLEPGQYRSGLNFVSELIERGAVQHVCVYQYERLSTSLKVWQEFKEDFLDKYHLRFFAAAEEDGLSAFLAKLTLTETDHLKSSNGLDSKPLREPYYAVRIISGPLCYGWKWHDRRKVPAGSPAEIEPCINEAQVVRNLYDWYLAGKNERWIAQELNRQGIASTRVNRLWSAGAVKKVLMNSRHCGLIKNQQGELVRGAHYERRLIEESTYYAFVERRKSHAVTRRGQRSGSQYWFLANSRCGLCGQRLHLINESGQPVQYQCRGNNPKLVHSSFLVSANTVERWVVQRIQEFVNDPQIFVRVVKAIEKITDAQSLSLLPATGNIPSTRGLMRKIQLEKLLNLLGSYPLFWKSMALDQKRMFADCLIEQFVVTPQEDQVKVRLQLALSEPQTLDMPFDEAIATGLNVLPPYLLSIAKDLLQKKDLTAIAERCGLRAHTLQLYRSRLVKATGARDLKEALEMLAPILAAQQEEGALDKNQAGIAGNGITEYEVGLLLLIAKRYTITEIADKLGLPTKEVERCRYTLYRKLGVTTSLDALATAIERNLISNILPRAKLSLRTQEMLRLLACGLTQGKVARIFSSTRAIFNNKLATLRKKMNVHSTNELITLARENGWMTDD